MSSITNINFKNRNVVTTEQSSPKKAYPIGKVALTSLSYLKSTTSKICFASTIGTGLVLGLSKVFLPCMLITQIGLVTLNFKKILYEVSIFFTILKNQDWWNEIDDNIVLGALPLRQHLQELKKLGITHVLTTVEPFELAKGLVEPINHEEWKQAGIENKVIATADFMGVPLSKLTEGVSYIDEVLTVNSGAKIYVHCKAGRGRSASMIVAYKIYNQIKLSKSKEELNLSKALDQEINTLKIKRPQINLNTRQKNAILKYLNINAACLKYCRSLL